MQKKISGITSEKRRIFTFILILITVIPFSASGNTGKNVSIDWNKGVITALTESAFRTDREGNPVSSHNSRISITKARIEASTLAKERARTMIARQLRTLRIDPDHILLDLINSDIRTRKLMSRCMDTKIKAQLFPVDFSTSGCRAELGLGDIIDALPFIYPEDEFPEPLSIPVKTDYTSLIIDARHLSIEEMVLPVIYNEDGLEIFSRHHIDIRYAAKYSMVSYVTNENSAHSHKKAGSHPFYTAALKSLNGCPVISNRDSRRILGSSRTRESLKKCRVIFVVKEEE